MKKKTSTILLIVVFIIGLAVLLYPTISDYRNSKVQSRVISTYDKLLSEYTPEDYTSEYSLADSYNERLYSTVNSFYTPEAVEGYSEALNITGTGVMGYITIDKINVQLPIYHGTSSDVLNVAVGHLEGSSLPVGGKNTHCVLSAHRGLPSAKLFSNLDDLDVGDTFTVTVLDTVLTYEVDQILIVLPSEVEDLQIIEGGDYCTLITCTPYGINTHRLLVRGKRIETEKAKERIYVTAEAYQIDALVVAPIVAAPMLLVLLIVLLIKYRKKK